MNRNIYITSMDQKRLTAMIEKENKSVTTKNKFYLNALASELKHATIVDSKEIPKNIITMNSMVKLKDLDHDEEMTFSLVYPDNADIFKNTLSILAPIGTAIIGYSVGDTIKWDVPGGTINLSILEIIYQPETYGHFEL